ncbi:hypothetical protein [Palleronia sp.]|uniref:hypothetical protein n=1 Tax=Palleronia sp. TaxID=1940284 RepID=UPI0035C82F85
MLRDLRAADLTPVQISRQAIDALQELAGGLEPAIRGETKTRYLHDANDMSIGHEEPAMMPASR